MTMRRLFFDIETSPCVGYFWRPGRNYIPPTNIITDSSIICIAWKWEHEDEVQALSWSKDRSDKGLIRRFLSVLNGADEVVAHNGDYFDLPFLRYRCIVHRIPMFPTYTTVDTLKKVKPGKYGFRFSSNRLDFIGDTLKVGRKMTHEGFELWHRCMQGDEEALDTMVTYCKQDVQLLADIHKVLEPYMKHTTHAAVLEGGYKHWCPSCGSSNTSRNGRARATSAGTPQVQVRCSDCKRQWRMSEVAYFASVGRQAKDEGWAK